MVRIPIPDRANLSKAGGTGMVVRSQETTQAGRQAGRHAGEKGGGNSREERERSRGERGEGSRPGRQRQARATGQHSTGPKAWQAGIGELESGSKLRSAV
jgi:hypothetical protein